MPMCAPRLIANVRPLIEGWSNAPLNDRICARVGAIPAPPAATEKIGIALQTLHLVPLNGLRHLPEGETCGWYIWGGTDLSAAPDFFEPLHVAHVGERCPAVAPYLALPPGWRFLVAEGQEDIWFDSALITPSA
jgi:hypothetical protein